MKPTKKMFRELLNEADKKNPVNWKHNQYHQRTRLYGDYLYNQDRDMFDENYGRWLKGNYNDLPFPEVPNDQ